MVTRPEKQDVVAHARRAGLTVVLGHPATVAESLAAGLDGLTPSDVVLLDWPDILWEPVDGHAQLVGAVVRDGHEIALGLFETPETRTVGTSSSSAGKAGSRGSR